MCVGQVNRFSIRCIRIGDFVEFELDKDVRRRGWCVGYDLLVCSFDERITCAALGPRRGHSTAEGIGAAPWPCRGRSGAREGGGVACGEVWWLLPTPRLRHGGEGGRVWKSLVAKKRSSKIWSAQSIAASMKLTFFIVSIKLKKTLFLIFVKTSKHSDLRLSSLFVLKETITKPIQRGGCAIVRNNYSPTISDYCNSRCKQWSLTILRPGLSHNRIQKVSMDNLSEQSS